MIDELVRSKNEHQIKLKITMFLVCTHEVNPKKVRAGLYGISIIILALYQRVSL